MLRLIISFVIVLYFSPLTGQDTCSNFYDGNADGQVSITDLIGLLAVFGDIDSDADGIWDSQDDCVDLLACNYNTNPTQLCKYIDVCGVCGGLGAVYDCGCNAITEGDCDCEGNQLDAVGVCGGNCGIDENFNGVCDDVEGCSDPSACNYTEGNIDPNSSFVGPCLELDSHKVHLEGPLAGMVTYRMYFHIPDFPDYFPDYRVVGVGGESGSNYSTPLVISTTTSFYQHPLGSAVSSEVLGALFDAFEELQYDSWVTIGHSPENGPSPQTISTLTSPNQPWELIFESGENLVMDDLLGGAWFILPGDNSLGLPDNLGRVLLGQFTTDGMMYANVNVTPLETLTNYTQILGLTSESCVVSDLCTYPDSEGNCN